MVSTRRGPVSPPPSAAKKKTTKAKQSASAKKVKNKVASPSGKARADILAPSDLDSDEYNYEDEDSLTSRSVAQDPAEDASASSRSYKFPKNLLQQLAIDIQAAGGIRDFNLTSTQALRDICDGRPELFGCRGDNLREKIRKKVFAWKKLDDGKYITYLRKQLKLTERQIKPRGAKLVNEVDSKPAAVEEDNVPTSVSIPKKAAPSTSTAESNFAAVKLDSKTQVSKMSTFSNTTYIVVNEKKPECNGPFLIYPVPDFPGVDANKEYKGYYIILPIDNRFVEMDDETNWYSASVGSDGKKVVVKVPAFPYAMFPKGPNSNYLYKHLTDQVADCVKKSMHHAHSDFDEQDGSAAETAMLEGRKWKYYELDFTKCNDFEGELSAQKLSSDAGEKEILDFDLLTVPQAWRRVTKNGQEELEVLAEEDFIGFKVANIDSTSSGRKTARIGQGKSKLAQKRGARGEAAMKTVATSTRRAGWIPRKGTKLDPKPNPVVSGPMPDGSTSGGYQLNKKKIEANLKAGMSASDGFDSDDAMSETDLNGDKEDDERFFNDLDDKITELTELEEMDEGNAGKRTIDEANEGTKNEEEVKKGWFKAAFNKG